MCTHETATHTADGPCCSVTHDAACPTVQGAYLPTLSPKNQGELAGTTTWGLGVHRLNFLHSSKFLLVWLPNKVADRKNCLKCLLLKLHMSTKPFPTPPLLYDTLKLASRLIPANISNKSPRNHKAVILVPVWHKSEPTPLFLLPGSAHTGSGPTGTAHYVAQ